MATTTTFWFGEHIAFGPFPALLAVVVVLLTGGFFAFRFLSRKAHRAEIQRFAAQKRGSGPLASKGPDGSLEVDSPPHFTLPVGALRGGWAIGYVAAVAAVLVLVAYRIWTYSIWGVSAAAVFFTLIAVYTVAMFFFAARGFDKYSNTSPAPGRIIAIVPAYGEEQDVLDETIRALLDSSIVPDEIHVVDDGSPTPVVPFHDPRVFWHRQENSGKRVAQALVLRNITPGQFAFLVTVDSDSRVAPNAIASALQALNDEEVQAVTSVITVSNRSRSLISLLADLEIVSGIFIVRRARAAVGAVTPTSGAFSVYRTAPILDNLDDYVASGTYSDDRRMAQYCLLRGKVVSVNGALVDTDMPDTFAATWRQRVRWYKGYWLYWPWETTFFHGWPVFFRYMSTLMSAVFPLAFAWGFVIMPLLGKGFFWPLLVLWLGLLYCQTLTFLWRPGLALVDRILTWLFVTPLLIPFQILLIRPAMYWALLSLRHGKKEWHRENARRNSGSESERGDPSA